MSTLTAAHYAGTYLKPTQNWIHTQIRHLKRYQPFVLTHQTKNLPGDSPPLHSSFDLPFLLRKLDSLGDRLWGMRPSFLWSLYKQGAHVMHAHFGPAACYVAPLAQRASIPLVTTFYGYDLTRLPSTHPVWRQRYDYLFEVGTLFLVEGSHMQERLVDLGCPRSKTRVQHLGVNLDHFDARPRRLDESEPLRLLMAGRFAEKKGFPYALEAFARFLNRGGTGTLTVIGGASDNPNQQAVERKIQNVVDAHDLESSVDFRGFLSHEELVEAYYHHHVLLAPSITASNGDTEGGAPVTLIEAAATGMPVVGSLHCDIPEVVINGKSGILVPERDVEALSQALSSIQKSPDQVESFGTAARRHVEQHYSARSQGHRLADLYDQARSSFSTDSR